MGTSLRLPFDDAAPGGGRRVLPDAAARVAAVDPRRNVVLEASAGTGKTRVLVDRYVNLLRAGVDPANILAMTFTRKAAAEMRDRIVATLRAAADESPVEAARWRGLRDRLHDIAISTIDAFCLALLREFPLEADLDPRFDVADDTAVPRLIEASLDRSMRICRGLARDDEDVALLFANLGERRLRTGLAVLLDRRLVADEVLARVLTSGPATLTIEQVCRQGGLRLAGALSSMPGGFEAFVSTGPMGHPAFELLVQGVRALLASAPPAASPYPPAALRALVDRLRAYFFTQDHAPRQKAPAEFKGAQAKDAARVHWAAVHAAGPRIDDAIRAWRRDLNVVLSRAVRRVFAVAMAQYRQTLDRHGVLDFAELLVRARLLLGNMDEFARSRYLLEARYHHVLVDEFQDTSRAQWDLVAQLVRAWGEGFGPAHDAIPPSIFIVGDRKQSIYGFRDADVALLDEAAAMIADLRPEGRPVYSITHSFRSVPQILAFVNDVFDGVRKAPDRPDAFRYDVRDAFPLEDEGRAEPVDEPALGLAVGPSADACAGAVAARVEALLRSGVVRDRATGVRRPAEPGDVAILFRARESHRVFERALEARGIPTYVYKGLGFFDTDEIKDIVALVRYVADPNADLRAAAFLRSRFVRLSDPGLQTLAPGLAAALVRSWPAAADRLDDEDRDVLVRARAAVAQWIAAADLVPPAELLDRILDETAYAREWRGPRLAQVRENVKKVRGLVRRVQNRGYLTWSRLADHFERLSAGDESNAAVDALNAVSLMTVHASKGLEFPVVFVVGLDQGTGGGAPPIRVAVAGDADDGVAVGDFQTEYDDDTTDRDAEETKRLLYVALTRGRDRLFLSAVVRDRRLSARRGSLASVCPAALTAVLRQASEADGHAGTTVEWQGASGRRHAFEVCPPATGPAGDPYAGARAEETPGSGVRGDRAPDDFEPLADVGSVRTVAVTTLTASLGGGVRRGRSSDDDRLLAGRLAHRLFQFGSADDSAVGPARARQLLRAEEWESATEPDRVVADGLALFRALRDRDEVRRILASGRCDYEVPFSLIVAPPLAAELGLPAVDAPARVRGAIDCLVERPDGTLVVLDFKTGRPRAEDALQLRVYERAVALAYPGSVVEAFVVYAGDAGDTTVSGGTGH